MNSKFDLDKSFDEWFNEVEVFGLRSERFYDECNPPNELVEKWLKAAYEQGAKAMAEDTVYTLRQYATVVSGLETKQVYPEEMYDTVALCLEAYYDDEVFGVK